MSCSGYFEQRGVAMSKLSVIISGLIGALAILFMVVFIIGLVFAVLFLSGAVGALSVRAIGATLILIALFVVLLRSLAKILE